MNLEKIDNYRWRIPKSGAMRVDGMIYADEKLVQNIRQDKSLNQVANVATLPGIVKYSLAMPDIHYGYGAPIGGVAAFDINQDGIISPGQIGYDINCLSGDSFILNELGYKIRIKDYEKSFPYQSITCMNFNADEENHTKISYFMKRKAKKVFTILTETGKQIIATEDHPFYTGDGMKKLKDLSIGNNLAIYPFEGVTYEKPSLDVIVNREDVKKLLLKLGKNSKGNALNQILTHLDKKNILPLRYNSPNLPYLIKIMGYCFGDGVLYCENLRNRYLTTFYGEKEDLFNIKQDLKKIGFKSKIYSRDRKHKIKTSYSTYRFETKEFCLRVFSGGFGILLACLGMPIGNKSRQLYGLPNWLFKAPLWQKRLFLAGLFGAELSSPAIPKGLGYNFYTPVLSMNKTKECLDNGIEFLNTISKILLEFGIKTLKISQRKEYINEKGVISHRLRLILSNKPDDLINLYSLIGFEYNKKRKFLANIAAQYLNLKKRIINEREEVALLAPILSKQKNWPLEQVYGYLKSPYVGKSFIQRSLYEPRKAISRMWSTNNLKFGEFKKIATEGLGNSGMTWDRIDKIIEIVYDDWVYDFTVEHKYHNFIANNFVVSNCGVRLVRTNLTEKDVKPRIKELVTSLYNNVPAGIGSEGKIRVTAEEEKKILTKGSAWAVSKGYGTKEDLAHTEDNGCMEGADPSKISERAYQRGKKQSGTLGSGNHFIEVQSVDEIYDEEKAVQFGIEKNQITIMIHSGSRGFGYQICDEYARDMIKTLSKFNISVPDRQLACAPVNSEEGKAYIGAMKCAANYAWNNRQCLMHLVREVFEKFFNRSFRELGMDLVYDVAHNIAKFEKYKIDGKEKLLCVHRKGATRAFDGQPVIIPGDMGRSSYLLVGTKKAEETFFSTCHGAGRLLSRKAAVLACRGRSISGELAKKGIAVMAAGRGTLAEEAPEAYKNISDVVDVVHGAGISKRVARMRPLGVIKG